MSDVQRFDYFDYPIPKVELIVSDMKLAAFMRNVLAVLFKRAIDDGWDVEHIPLLLMHRKVEHTITCRLARIPSDEVFEKWMERGWRSELLSDWMRVQLLELFRVTV